MNEILDQLIGFRLLYVDIFNKCDDFIGICLFICDFCNWKKVENVLLNLLGKVIFDINCLERNFFIS